MSAQEAAAPAKALSIRVPPPGKNDFKFDRTVTIAVCMALILESASVLMWVGAANARLVRLEATAAINVTASERLARLEAEVSITRQQLDRIEARLARSASE